MGNNFFDKLSAKRQILAKQLTDPAAAGFWKMVVDKYSVKAHFLYELIQNCDDAKARNARFLLTSEGLYFIHDGSVAFTLTDPDEEGNGKPIGHLNAITSIGASTKKDGSYIGKFGIGFKSVFQYTACPHIEDDNFSFRLTNYIVPEFDNPLGKYRKPGETLFYFPFNNPQLAISEIKATLDEMENPLMFMRNLCGLEWKSEIDGACFKWENELISSDTFTGFGGIVVRHDFVEINSTIDLAGDRFHFFWTDVEYADKKLSCSVVYSSDSDGRVLPLKSPSKSYCFFELEDDVTRLPFLIHAPFLLTENREHYKKNEEWNVSLFNKLATLAASLVYFDKVRDGNGLASDFLFYYPLECIESEKYYVEPFQKALVEALKTDSVVRADDGGFVDASCAIYAEESALPTLFSNTEIESIMTLKGKKWCYSFLWNLPASKRQYLEQFLTKNKLINKTLSIDNLIRFIPSDVLSGKNDAWLLDFYSLITKHKSIIKSDWIYSLPIIKCDDGIFRSIYAEGSVAPQIYLKSGDEDISNTSFFYANRIFNEDKLKDFCSNLNISVPSELTYIEKSILSSYQNGTCDRANISKSVNDLIRIATYYSSVAYDFQQKDELVTALRDIAFIPVVWNDGGANGYSTPSCVYFDSKNLRAYFGETSHVCFLDTEVILSTQPEDREKLYYFLNSLGVSFYPRIVTKVCEPSEDLMNRLNLHPVSLRVQDNGCQVIVDKEFDGFSNFVSNWSEKSALAFYRMLGEMLGKNGSYAFRRELNGIYTYFEKSKKLPTTEQILKTTAYNQLYETKWLPCVDGSCAFIDDIKSYTDLIEECSMVNSDAIVLQFLGISFDSTILNLTQEQRNAIKLVGKLKAKGISEEDLKALIDGTAEIKWRE